MAKTVTVEFEPLGRRARVETGTTLLEAARVAGVGLNAVCGGAGTCGTCRVRVMDGEVSPPAKSEAKAVAQGLRLACQARARGDVRVDVPRSSISAPQRAQVEGQERSVDLDPAMRIFEFEADPPGLEDLRADATRLKDALREQHGVETTRVDAPVLRQVPALMRETGWHARAVVHAGEIMALMSPTTAPLGLAVDIGTTKVAAYLVDLTSGETLEAAGVMNPQIAYGEDVMARITYAMDGERQARELQAAIIDGLSALARELCHTSGRACEQIVEAVLVGNTCMHHLVLGLPVSQLGLAPYVAALTDPYDLKARDLGLRLAPGANVHLLPNIAGFVGADHVSMVLAAGLHETEAVTVGLDIGTNTEISLAAHGRLLSCSTASGPAFEGAHIHDGMRAAPGAVEWVRILDHRVEYQTIDNAPPVGICGSGILDAVAQLRKVGVVRANGAMRGDHPRMRQGEDGAEFVLVPAGERGAPRDVVITRRDINEIQLAKGAMRAGVEVLLSEVGLTTADLERVVVAGAFGTYLDIDSARAIDMFPRLPRERFDQVGNAAGIGAKMALLSQRCRSVTQEIARRSEYIELTTHTGFVEAYTEALMLPEVDPEFYER